MNTINVENCKTLLIGRRGENDVTTVAFDFTEWASEFGSGVVDLYVKRNGDDSAYPVVLTVDGTVASWLVTETDTNVAGYGKAEYVYRVDGKIAKSAVFPFFVAEDIGQPASEPPDPYESWLEQLTALGAETEAHAQAAEQSAENAAQSAESAEGYAGQAETSAGLAQAAQTASEAARDAAQTAQASAESSATAASGSAASAAGSATAAAGSASDSSASATAAGASATAASASATTASNAATAAQNAQSAAEDAAEDAQQAAQQAHVEYEQLSGEVDDLSDEVSQQKSAIDEIANTVYDPVSLYREDDYMQLNGTMGTGAYHAALSVTVGEVYKIKVKTGINVHAYVLIVGGNVYDSYSTTDPWGTEHDYDIEYKVAATGTLYINSIASDYLAAKKKRLELVCQNDVNTLKAETNDTIVKKVSYNLFDKSQYNLGYRRSSGAINSDTQYCYTKPILLSAGTYLYTAVGMFGANDKVYRVYENGDLIGLDYIITPDLLTGGITEIKKYNNRRIKKFTLTETSYVSLNIGYVVGTYTEDQQLSNFMLVVGSTIDDFPLYQPYFDFYTIDDNIVNGLSGLRFKRSAFDGDSICHGTSVGQDEPSYGYGWAGRIGIANHMNWLNNGVSGGVITSATNALLTGRHSVVDSIDAINSSYGSQLDYYIFEGGTNDADLLGSALTNPSILGTLDPDDYGGSYDATTFTGAMDTICYKAVNYWKGKHLGYIVAPKMGRHIGTPYDAEHDNRRAYFARAIAVCEKWGIPVLDLWDYCYLNPSNNSCYDQTKTSAENIAAGNMYVDGQHLTAKGYDYISSIIEAWMKTL